VSASVGIKSGRGPCGLVNSHLAEATCNAHLPKTSETPVVTKPKPKNRRDAVLQRGKAQCDLLDLNAWR